MLIITIKVNILLETFKKYLQLNYDRSKRQSKARHLPYTKNRTTTEGNGQTAYIKPQNYEISKTRKYKKDISRRENMEYHADRDSYICRNGGELTVTNERRSKTASGYVSVKTYYRSPDCTGCPYKTECIKGNNCKTPMEKRNKVLMVSKTMSQKRAEDLERITSE